MRTCPTCGLERPVAEFRKWRRRCTACLRAWKSAYDKARMAARPELREANKARSRAWAKAHPEITALRARSGKLKNKYGITPRDEAAMRAAQGGLCAFSSCSAAATDVDHIDLPTGPWVRGLLCHDHNVALGHLHDRIEDANDAAEYLRADARRREVAV